MRRTGGTTSTTSRSGSSAEPLARLDRRRRPRIACDAKSPFIRLNAGGDSMVRFCSPGRARAVFLALAFAAGVWAQPIGGAQTARTTDLPSPEQFFGYQMGADRKLANWDKLHEYYQTLAKSAKNMRLVELGKSS